MAKQRISEQEREFYLRVQKEFRVLFFLSLLFASFSVALIVISFFLETGGGFFFLLIGVAAALLVPMFLLGKKSLEKRQIMGKLEKKYGGNVK